MGGTLRSWQIRCQRRDRSAFSGPRMSLVVVVSGPHAGASAGAPGLVETRRWVRESCGGDTHGTGDMPTGAAGAAGGTSEGCGEGELLCERGCVDLLSDEARCGCDDECKSDEMCVVGECREVEGGGLRELSLRGPVSGRGQRRHGQRRHGQRRRWWRRPPASPVLTDGGDPQVSCVKGDEEDLLVCASSGPTSGPTSGQRRGQRRGQGRRDSARTRGARVAWL